MTNAHSFRTLIVSFVLVAVAFAVLAAQYAASFFAQGLRDSAGIRVSANTACAVDGAHFTGCSSIL